MRLRFFSPKLLFVPLALLMSCFAIRADEVTDPLDKRIPGGWTYNSFDEAIHQIEEKTGFKVSCPNDLRAFMQTIWMKGTFFKPDNTTTVKVFLDQMGGLLALNWSYAAAMNTLTLEPRWKISDPRTPSELLKAVWQPGYWADYEKDPKWQTAFNALLSADVNFEKAWKVRQKSSLQGMRMFADAGSKPILMKQVIDASGAKYILVLICQEIQMYPGHGSASYYWFKDDGTLVGAGLMNTGHRCKVVDTTIDNEFGARSGMTTELQMILKMNERDFMTAMFVLDSDGLKLTHLLDAHSGNVNLDIHVGQSLMESDEQ